MSDQTVAETSTWQLNNTDKTETSMPPAGFEPTIPASQRPQTHVLDNSDTGIGWMNIHTIRRCKTLASYDETCSNVK